MQKLRSPPWPPFSPLVAKPLPDQDLKISADLDSRTGVHIIHELDILSGESDLSITGRATNPSFPALTLVAESQRINLEPWTSTYSAAATDMAPGIALPESEVVLPEIASFETTPPATASEATRLITDYPISFKAWEGFEANILVNIERLTGLIRPLDHIASALSLKQDGLRIDRFFLDTEGGGSLTLVGSLLGQDETPQLDLALNAEGLHFGLPKAPNEDIDALPSYDVKMRLTGLGATTQTLASSLNG